MHEIKKVQHKPLTYFMKALTYSGTSLTWLSAAITLTFLNQIAVQHLVQQELLLRSMLAALMAWIIGKYLKTMFARKRPSQKIENYSTGVQLPSCNSFPSTHASSSFAFFTALLLFQHPFAYYVGMWATLVAFSRYYLGVHFPSDLFGGIILGLFCGSGLYFFYIFVAGSATL